MHNIALALLLAVAAPAAQAQNASPPPVDAQSAIMMVRYALVALDQANKSNNYAVLRDLGTTDFRETNSVARLGELFAAQRQAGLNLALAAVVEPTWTTPPSRDAAGLLRLNGTFAAPSGQTRFDIVMQAAGGGWQLAGIAVSAQPKVLAASQVCAPAK